jgi:transcriptional regulator with XRE-family HTH domain
VARRWIVRSDKDLGRSIAGLRDLRGMTQAELATATGIERSYLARIESGHATQMIDRLIQTLRALGAELTVQERTDEP